MLELVGTRSEEFVPLIADTLPKAERALWIQRRSAEPPARLEHGGPRACQADAQTAPVPGARLQWHGLRTPARHLPKSPRLVPLVFERRAVGRGGQHFQGHLADDAEHPPGTRDQPRDIVARHVLHDLAAERQKLAAPIEQRQPQHVIAQRPDGRARRSREAGGHHAADGTTRGEAWRLERQALTFRGECALELGERRAGANGDHQLARFVARDAGQVA